MKIARALDPCEYLCLVVTSHYFLYWLFNGSALGARVCSRLGWVSWVS